MPSSIISQVGCTYGIRLVQSATLNQAAPPIPRPNLLTTFSFESSQTLDLGFIGLALSITCSVRASGVESSPWILLFNFHTLHNQYTVIGLLLQPYPSRTRHAYAKALLDSTMRTNSAQAYKDLVIQHLYVSSLLVTVGMTELPTDSASLFHATLPSFKGVEAAAR